ncbi:ATP-binding cassette sub- B member 10, mitochondrial [Chytridiales sp. JEL 0842]|nr:ATP-binding cassette sub- B member 10, mitochondrial [Chytridiales sp. JEL 0842]
MRPPYITRPSSSSFGTPSRSSDILGHLGSTSLVNSSTTIRPLTTAATPKPTPTTATLPTKLHPPPKADIESSKISEDAQKKIDALTFRRNLRKIIQLAKPEVKILAGAVALLCVSSGVTMSVPFSMGKILDLVMINLGVQVSETSAVAGLSPDLSLPFIFTALAGIFAVGAAANFGRVILMRMAAERLIQRMRNEIFGNIMRQDMAFFDKNSTGDIISRLSSDTLVVGKSITNNISDGLRSGIMALAGLGMMLYVNPTLTLIMMTIVPPVSLGAILYGRRIRTLSQKTQDALSKTTQLAEEKVSHIRTVRAFAQEGAEVGRYKGATKGVYELSMQEALANGLFFGGAGLSGNLILLAILYYGGSMVTSGAISVGDLTSFFLYTAYVGSSMIGISGFYSELMKGVGASGRLFELLEGRGSVEGKESGLRLEEFKGKIEFRDVSFAYPTRSDSPIFTSLSFTIYPNTSVAIVGRSGSGKSSIAQLLLRFYDPTSGSIIIDDKYDLRTLDPIWWRTHCLSFVSQEPTLFSTTIGENIAYGLPASSEREIQQAAEAAHASSFIDRFPQGYNTPAGERGSAISGGQRQRIAIARALIKNPKMLIMDEATSALDASSEALVQKTLSEVTKDRTVITIAHRLSTIQQADRVVLIEDGKVGEEGGYEELVERKGGRFRGLVEAQLVGGGEKEEGEHLEAEEEEEGKKV